MSTIPTTVYGGALSPPPPPQLPSNSISQNLYSLGLGYVIAIALGFLVLLSTVILASYVCCRAAARRRSRNGDPEISLNASPDNGIYLPRIIFVAEDDEDDNGNDASQNTAVGLEQVVINSYPKFQFSKIQDGGGGGNDSMCSICLCDYKDAEMLRVLPDCGHYFHLYCIDSWLKLNASCPVCRNSPLPTPLSTPLSEVVPLSQYSDGRRR